MGMGKKKKKKRKVQSKISRILSSSNDAQTIRKKYFSDLSPEEIKANFPRIFKHRHFQEAVGVSKVSGYEKFYTNHTPQSTLIKNIYWILGLLKSNKERIQHFLETEDKIVENLLAGNNDRVLTILNELDKVYGLSTWTVSIRCSILTMTQKYNDHKSFLTAINNKSGNNNFFQAVIKKISDRYDESSVFISNIYSFRTQLQRYLKGEMLHFLMYKLIPTDFNFDYDYDHIIRVEKNSSIIDMFHCLIEFICFAKTSDHKKYDNYAYIIVHELNSLFVYPPIQGLANSYGIETSWTFSKDEYDLLDLYTCGNYSKIKAYFRKNPKQFTKFSAFEILSKSCARIDEEVHSSTPFKILNCLIDVYLKNENYNDSISYLFSMCHSFSSLSWFKELYFVLIRETTFLSEELYCNLNILSSSFSTINSPKKINSLPCALREKTFSICQQAISSSVSLDLFKLNEIAENNSTFDLSIDSNRLKKYISIAQIKNDNIDSAIINLKELAESEDFITAHEATRLLSDVYIKSKKNQEVIDLYIEKSINNKNLILNFDTEKICSIAKDMVTVSNSITVPIALSLHSRYVDSNFDSVLKYSFEMFLKNNRIDNPIDIIQKKEMFNEKQFFYFLEFVCTPEVMKLYLFFENTIAIENCRLDICKYLVENNSSKEQLIDEIKERTKVLVIRKAVKQVDNSRIYSNTNLIKMGSVNSFKQLFEKFQVLQTQDFSNFEDEATLKELYETLKTADELSNAYMVFLPNTPLNEKNSTFLKLLKLVRDEFTYGDKGLNSHLSTRIRHGHFPTTLRKCVADEQLVTPKLTNSKSYRSNTHWLSILDHIDQGRLSKIDKAFNNFSSNFEKMIYNINDSWIQIWTLDYDITTLAESKKRADALFNYSVSDLEAYSLQQKLFIDSDYNDFTKIVITWLWERTEINLLNIRNKLSTEVREEANTIIDDFEKEVLEIVGDQRYIRDLSNALGRARSSLSLNLDQIISWFKRSEGSIVDKFDFDTAIEIAKMAATTNVTYKQEYEYEFDGTSLSYFVDILYILFENAISKSNLSKDELIIKAQLIEDTKTGALILSVENNCVEVSSIENANEEIDFYRKSYGKDSIINGNVQGEGGTGFFKIWKILFKDLELQHNIEFGYDKKDKFGIKIQIYNPQKVIYNENTIN